MRGERIGREGIAAFAVVWGALSGLIGFLIWGLLIKWLGIDALLADFGLPDWLGSNVPVSLAAPGGAAGAATVLIGEAREARLRLVVKARTRQREL